jgi:hypothetical protein
MLAHMTQGPEDAPTQRHVHACMFKFLNVPKSCLTDNAGTPRRITSRSKKQKKLLRPSSSWEESEADLNANVSDSGEQTPGSDDYEGSRLTPRDEGDDASITCDSESGTASAYWLSDDEAASTSASSSFRSDTGTGTMAAGSDPDSFRSCSDTDADVSDSGTFRLDMDQGADVACSTQGRGDSVSKQGVGKATSSTSSVGMTEHAHELCEVEQALQSARGALNISFETPLDSESELHNTGSKNGLNYMEESEMLSGHMSW